ncbi:MAG: hypothetical protein EBY79_04985 [Actinobacteria bacterium]|nr:hypothetical protein [Actinomycetota bacterium]
MTTKVVTCLVDEEQSGRTANRAKMLAQFVWRAKVIMGATDEERWRSKKWQVSDSQLRGFTRWMQRVPDTHDTSNVKWCFCGLRHSRVARETRCGK